MLAPSHIVLATPKAREFMKANKQSPVVVGEAIGIGGGQGCRYILEDGRAFRLSAEDCQSMPVPRWLHDK